MTNILKVRTPVQKTIFEEILQGQISDGHWENDDTDIRLWDCEVLVSNDGVFGCDFKPIYPLDFTDLEYVLDSAVEVGQAVDPSYDIDYLKEDLEELTTIVFGNWRHKV